MMEHPNLIFKYRALSSREDIDRFYDILKYSRLYLPTIPQVNDPFEGKIDISAGVAGDSIRRAMDIDFFVVRECKEHTRLLALSEDCFSPQLWAYYCNNYCGVCLCYYTGKTFSRIQPVSYPEIIEDDGPVTPVSRKQIYDLVKGCMFRKQEGWRYEKEWRMVFQPELDENDDIIRETKPFLNYESDELAAVIIGDKLEGSMKEMIRALIPEGVSVFEVHTGAVTGKVKIMEYGYVYPGTGAEPDYIETVEELYRRVSC